MVDFLAKLNELYDSSRMTGLVTPIVLKNWSGVAVLAMS